MSQYRQSVRGVPALTIPALIVTGARFATPS